MKQNKPAIPDKLTEILKKQSKAAIAFSGGVDSSYLLYAAKASHMDVRAYYVNSQFQPAFELEDAKQLAEAVRADMKIMPLDVLQSEIVVSNPPDRCYHCKQVIFGMILEQAATDGYTTILDGTNASDDAGDRPGMRALAEMKVMSPLRDAGLTKAQIRAYSKEAGLFTWDKPSYACLATRIPTGTPLTAEALLKVEKAEDSLFSMGFTDFRVRVLGEAAKLQFPAEQIQQAAGQYTELAAALSPWFADVLLDLKPR